MPVEPDDDHPKEACGVFAAYTPGVAAAYLAFDGLFALQHRGQESAGMAVSDGTQLWIDNHATQTAKGKDKQ